MASCPFLCLTLGSLAWLRWLECKHGLLIEFPAGPFGDVWGAVAWAVAVPNYVITSALLAECHHGRPAVHFTLC